MTTSTIDATPAAKRRAKELELDLEKIEGTGTDGRITIDDVEIAGRGDAAEQMPDRAHAEGCPAPEERIEIYDQRRPAKRDADGSVTEPACTVRVVHCVECGGTKLLGRVTSGGKLEPLDPEA